MTTQINAIVAKAESLGVRFDGFIEGLLWFTGSKLPTTFIVEPSAGVDGFIEKAEKMGAI